MTEEYIKPKRHMNLIKERDRQAVSSVKSPGIEQPG